jgi:hypothetical protein
MVCGSAFRFPKLFARMPYTLFFSAEEYEEYNFFDISFDKHSHKIYNKSLHKSYSVPDKSRIPYTLFSFQKTFDQLVSALSGSATKISDSNKPVSVEITGRIAAFVRLSWLAFIHRYIVNRETPAALPSRSFAGLSKPLNARIALFDSFIIDIYLLLLLLRYNVTNILFEMEIFEHQFFRKYSLFN